MPESPQFDFARWQTLIPLSLAEAKRDFEAVAGPRDLLAYLLVQQHIAERESLRPCGSCDGFVFGGGQPPLSACTRLGGVPHRAASLPWPNNTEGITATFVGQLRIEDEQLRSKLPGDILLIFAFRIALGWPGSDEDLYFEWSNSDDQDLCTETPPPRFPIPLFYGERHRVLEYDVASCGKHFERSLLAVVENDFRRQLAARSLCRFAGTKVGGAPFWIMDEQQRFADQCAAAGKTFIGSLPGIVPFYRDAYALVNSGPEKPDQSRWLTGPEFYLRDGHVLNFWLDHGERVIWSIDFF